MFTTELEDAIFEMRSKTVMWQFDSKTVMWQDITFSKMVENCATTQENAVFLTSWLKPRKTTFWSKRKM